jgi:hypothetical protein
MTTIQAALTRATITTSAPTAAQPKADEGFFAKHKVALIAGGVGAAALAIGGIALLRQHSASQATAAAATVEAARLTPEEHAAKAVAALDRAAAEFKAMKPASLEAKVADSTFPYMVPGEAEKDLAKNEMFAPTPEFSKAFHEGTSHANAMIDEILKRHPSLTTSSEQAYNTWKTERGGGLLHSVVTGEPMRYKTTTETVTRIPGELSELRASIGSWSDLSAPYSRSLIYNPMETNVTPLRDAIAGFDLTKYATAA